MVDKKKLALSRRQILGGLGAVGAASAGAGLGTTALFSDVESFNNNEITAGTLDLVVDYQETYSFTGGDSSGEIGETGGDPGPGPVSGEFSLGDVKPGDDGSIRFCPKVLGNPGWVWIGVENVSQSGGDTTEPEPEPDNGELAENIQVDVEYCDKDGNTLREFNNPVDYTLEDLFKELESGFLLDGENVNDGSTDAYPASDDSDDQQGPCLCIDWEVPASVGNVIQDDSVSFDVVFEAVQERNNADPENPFATTTVWPGGSIQSAISNASGGDVISVFGGSFGDGSNYAEELDVDTSVTLARASAEQPTIAADAQNDNRAITVTASDVTLDGLDITFTGGAGSSPNAEKYGIEVRAGSDDLTVCNCNVRDIITDEAGRDGSGSTTDVNAVRSTGLTIKSTLGSGSSVSAPTVRHNTFQNLVCTGSTTQDGNFDSDSRAKGVALVGDVNDAVISGNEIVGIGTSSNDPPGAQISSVNAVGPNDPNGNQYTTSASDNQAAEGTDKPRGIDIIQAGASTAPSNFVIENNVLGGTGGDAIVGVYGQPAIFIGGSGGMGPDHDVRGNDIYHPVDNLNGAVPLNLNGENSWYDTSGNSQSPSLVPPDQDEDGGNLIDRAGGSEYAGQP